MISKFRDGKSARVTWLAGTALATALVVMPHSAGAQTSPATGGQPQTQSRPVANEAAQVPGEQSSSSSQDATGSPGVTTSGEDEIVVTAGYAQSLENSANAKKNTTNFTDSIFAEDIGKFPDLNLAESLQRLPGVQIDRDTSGEGTYINVRGLSAGFTVLTVNGFAVSTSSNGFNEGRGSALDILPSELFRRLTLSKSPIASGVEGGTAGSVDMQPIGPFDRKGFHVSLQAQASYQDASKTTTPRIAGIISNTFEDTPIGDFGIVVAGAYAKRDYRSEIFNTVGYVSPNIGNACPATRAGCNSRVLDPSQAPASNPTAGYGGSGAGMTLTTVPGNIPASFGLPAAGRPLVQCTPGAPGGSSGLSCEDLSYAIVPRLVRAEQVVGARDRKTGMLNLEWRPTDGVSLRFDSLLSESDNNFGQHDVMMVVRNYNNNIPVNWQLDDNHVLTSGTFANTYFLNQSTDAQQHTRLFYRSLSADWQVADNFRISASGMMNTGEWKHDQIIVTLQSAPWATNPQVFAAGTASPAGGGNAGNSTPVNTGQYLDYSYTPGQLTPHISTSIDLPNFTGWYWNSIGITPNRQDLKQKSGRIDFVAGDAKAFQLSVGSMLSSFERNIATWQTSDCAFRNACTSAFASQETSVLGAVPNSQLANFLTDLPASGLFANAPFDAGFNGGWKVIDFDKLRQAVNLDYYQNEINPGDQPANYLNSYSPRKLKEDSWATYAMVDGQQDIFGRELRFNAGVRYVWTRQANAAIVNETLLGGANRTAPLTVSTYEAVLPSANLAYFLDRNLVLRGAAARTMTRPNPSDLAPTYGLSLDGDIFTKGNPALKPFYANNFDVGIEWYPQSRTVLTLNLWWKNVMDYPAQIDTLTPFPATGIDFSRLSDRQRNGITNLGQGDPNNAQLIVRQKMNSDVVVHLFGQEFQWIQPLDFLVKGVGFNANVTHISQSVSGTLSNGLNPNSLISGLAPWTYNGTVFYENKDFSVRFSYTHRDQNLNTVGPQNNLPGDLYSIASDYLDAQVSFAFPWYKRLKFTLQAQNLLQQVQVTRWENRESQPDGATYAGRNFVVGARLNF